MHYEKLKALMKRSLWWKKVYDEKKKNYSLKIKVSEVLLCFKDKVSDESTSLC